MIAASKAAAAASEGWAKADKRLGALESRMSSLEAKMDRVLTLLEGAGGGHEAGKARWSPTNAGSNGLGLLEKQMRQAQENSRPSPVELKAGMSRLRPVETKASTGTADAEISAIAQIYTGLAGDLGRVAREFSADLGLLRQSPPEGAQDFAKRLLEGRYTKPGGEVTITLRPPTAAQLQTKGARLKSVEMKVGGARPKEAEISCLAGIYTRYKGDLDKIAAVTGLNRALLKKVPPADATDFGKKMLAGVYADAASELGLLSHLPDDHIVLSAADLQNRAGNLKQTEVSRKATQAGDDTVAAVAQIFHDHAGDLEKLASVCGLSIALLQKTPPKDAEQFARKVLDGFYTDHHSEQLRSQFGHKLQDELLRSIVRLKKLESSELSKDKVGSPSKPSKEDVERVAQIYISNRGDIDGLAKACGIKPDLLRRRQPKSATDFAMKLFAGTYMAEKHDLAREQLRGVLEDALPAASRNLNQTETREVVAHVPVAADVEAVARIYTQNGGDLPEIATICGIDAIFLRKNPPDDAQDFAKKLLGGLYA